MSNQPLPYLYSVIRLMPDLDRGECVNVGLLMFSRPHRFLRLQAQVNEPRTLALWPEVDLRQVQGNLATLELIAAGDPAGGPVAALDIGERFHWLSNVSNTIVQPGPVHPGVTTDAMATFDRLFAKLVASPNGAL